MRYLFLTSLTFLVFLVPCMTHAATEFKSIVDPDNGEGADYTSLAAWESSVQSDLATTTTRVFSGTATGSLSQGDTVTINSSTVHDGVEADVVAITTAGQILVENATSSEPVVLDDGDTLEKDASNYWTVEGTGSELGDTAIAVATCRSTEGSADTTSVTIDGWTTSETNYVKVWTDPDKDHRHSGKWDDSAYRLEVNNEYYPVAVRESYTRISGIMVDHGNYDNGSAIYIKDAVETQIESCIIKGGPQGIYNYVSGNTYINNNIVYSATESAFTSYPNNSNTYWYNNTAVSCGTGFNGHNGDNNCTNCLAYKCETGFVSIENGSNNISSDDTAPGDNSVTNANVTFKDEANDDFHLAGNDTAAKNAGTDLSSDSNHAFSTDIDDETRPYPEDGKWDIGADEAVYHLPTQTEDFLTDGLMAYWSFDGSAMDWSATGVEIRDLSGNSHHGSAENITSANVTVGRQGQGLSFNGSDEYVGVGNFVSNFLSGESYRKKITIQSSEVDESLTDFPVYVDLSTLGSDFFSETNSGCADVRVTESDGSTEVPREIVSCDRTAETGEMHFKAPSLFASSDTEFYIYYGYGGSDYTDSDTYGAENVWTNGYAGVWHLGEGSDSAEDSTSNSYDGAFNGDLPSQITGQIGSAQDFDGSGDMVEIAGDVAGGLSALTISAWLKADITGLDMGVCGNDPSGDGDRQTGFGYDESGYESGNSNGFKGGIYYKDIGPESSSDMQTTDWQLVHYWWDGGYPEFYFDGSLDTDSYPNNSINGTTDTPTNWYIGSGRKDDWAGFIDEVRISSSARSSGWIATEYNNQNSPGTFYNVGSEESTSNDPIKIKTISFWIKADDLTDRKIMDIDGTAHIEIDSSSNIIATDFPSPDVYVDGSDASAEITSDWHHVVITDSTGVEASAVDLARASNEYFDGTLDQVRFYDRVLSQDEIDKLYRHGARKLQPNTSQKGTQSDGLVGHWTFDGQDIDWSKTGAEVRDVSGQENHGSLEGGMGQHSVSIGKQGQALSFNGSDDHIAIDNSNSLDFGTGDFTYSLWVKSSQDCSGNKVYLGSYDQQESDPATWLGCNDSGYATFDVADSNNSGTSAIYNSSVVNDGEWHHIVGVKKGHSSASITTYFDADPSTVESSSFTGDFNYAGTNPHSIGRYEVSPYYYAEGSINDVRIYNKALSQDEIDKLYRHGARKLQPNTSQKGTQSDGLVGHWTFDGQDIDWSKTGAEVRDVSGQENHGSLEGGMGQHSVTIGKQGQALSFDGENDYVEINHAYSAFDNHDFTVSVWAKKETSDKVNEYRIVGSEDSGNEGNADIWWLLGTRDKNNGIGGQITAQFDDDVNKIFLQDINNASFVPQKGDWNFYTIKHVEGSGYYLYANGEQIFFSGEDNGSIVEGTHSFYIGIDGRDEGPWNGDIDDVRIYDRALSEEEIQKLYRKTGRKLQI